MNEHKTIEKTNGKKGVKLELAYGTLTLLTMRNGYQWSGCGVDDELMEMIVDVIDEYQSTKDNIRMEHK